MVQKNVIFKCGVLAILALILAGILYLLLKPAAPCNDDGGGHGVAGSNDKYSDPAGNSKESLRRLIVLVQPGPRNALVRLPGLDLDAGVLLADARPRLQEDGSAFKSKYDKVLEGSSMNWLTTSDPWVYESSEAWIAGLELNLTVPMMVPPIFGGSVEELYIRMIPLLGELRGQMPQCLIELAEEEVPGAPEEVVTFWAYLIGEGVDNLNASTLSAMNLTFGDDCLTEGEAVISDELFANVTKATADLLAPMLSNVMIEVLSLGNPTALPDANSNSLSVYGMSEWHLQLLLLCVRQDAWLGKAGHHVVLELYDSRVNLVYGKRTKSMSTLDFVRSIALCGAYLAANQ